MAKATSKGPYIPQAILLAQGAARGLRAQIDPADERDLAIWVSRTDDGVLCVRMEGCISVETAELITSALQAQHAAERPQGQQVVGAASSQPRG
jgi:hypothetical protein